MIIDERRVSRHLRERGFSSRTTDDEEGQENRRELEEQRRGVVDDA